MRSRAVEVGAADALATVALDRPQRYAALAAALRIRASRSNHANVGCNATTGGRVTGYRVGTDGSLEQVTSVPAASGLTGTAAG